MQCKIVIPSFSRAERVVSKMLSDEAIICIPKSQEEAYRFHNPDHEIVTHPDDVVGLPAKRNWMANHFKELFMMDDDIEGVQYMATTLGEKAKVTSKEEIRTIIQNLYRRAKLIGVSVFGFGNIPTPFQYDGFKPFSLTNRITGCSYGVIANENTKWNEDIAVKEDFWISGYVMYKERKILLDYRYHFLQQKTFKNPGGLSKYRNNESEMRAILSIRKHFGESIKLKRAGHHRDSVLKYNITSSFRI